MAHELNNLEIETDRLLVTGMVTNLLRNAFKFSRAEGTIALRATKVSGERLRLEVEDECVD
jgi:signal transduction histidine kinase